MNCREAIEFLQDYAEGRLPEEIRRSFQAHLDTCPPCGDFLRSYRSTAELSRAAFEEPCAELPAELLDAILRARRREDPGGAGEPGA